MLGLSVTRVHLRRTARVSARRAVADVAQLVEHFTRNEGVSGSNPLVGFTPIPGDEGVYGPKHLVGPEPFICREVVAKSRKVSKRAGAAAGDLRVRHENGATAPRPNGYRPALPDAVRHEGVRLARIVQQAPGITSRA
jgi:hypothetical protein